MKTTLLMGAALAGIITVAANAGADDKMTGMEKCYGIVKAGKNDCASKAGGNSCAGQAAKDGQGFVIVPQGLCDKLVGGTTAEK